MLERVPADALTLHFHNTRGLGLANVLAAYDAGARRFDAALGGLGGCPFAPGASGNICTEDLVNLCDEMGIPDRHRSAEADRAVARACRRSLGHDVPGQLAKAGRNCDLHPVPEYVRTDLTFFKPHQHTIDRTASAESGMETIMSDLGAVSATSHPLSTTREHGATSSARWRGG